MRHRTPRDGPGEFVPLWYVSNLMAVVHDILACGTVIDDVESSLFDEGCWSQTLDVCELVSAAIFQDSARPGRSERVAMRERGSGASVVCGSAWPARWWWATPPARRPRP